MDVKDYPKVDGKSFDEWPAWEGRGLPLRENCDLTNPRQAMLWTFTAMPGLKGAPLPFPTEYFELLSYHQWILGNRPVVEPLLKYRPPKNIVADRWTAQGDWVDLSEPDAPRPTMADIVAKLPQQDRAELKTLILDKLGVEDVPDPAVPAGYFRVEDIAKRLGIGIKQVQALLESFGMKSNAGDLVHHNIADRITAHLGL